MSLVRMHDSAEILVHNGSPKQIRFPRNMKTIEQRGAEVVMELLSPSTAEDEVESA